MVALVCAFAGVRLNAGEFSKQTNFTTATAGNTKAFAKRGFKITTVGGGGIVSGNFGQTGTGTGWGTMTTGSNSFTYTPGNTIPGVTSPFTWTGLTTEMGVEGSSVANSYTVYYKWSNASTVYNFIVPVRASTISLTYNVSQGGVTYHELPLYEVTLTRGTGDQGLPPDSGRGEIMMLLRNLTGVEQLVYFGTKLLKLAPGMNMFRYDGQLNSAGLPAVAPFDFQGTAFSGSDGTNYVAGSVDWHASGEGVSWAEPPDAPSVAPGGTKDRIEVISPETAGKGATVIIHHPGGGRTITTLPVTPASTASNTTGAGGVISNPTEPKPSQTTNNTTTTNTTNNTTNNSTVNNTTIINNNGDSDSDEDNSASVNSADFDTHGLTEGDAQGKPSLDVVAGLGSARGAASTKFGNVQVLAAGGVPKATSYTLSMNLGHFGQVNRDIDFTEAPFPIVRAAMVIAMGLGFAVAFLKRATI